MPFANVSQGNVDMLDTTQNNAPIVQMNNIEKHFGNIIALAGVSFDVRPGECHCLLGDNGAGKSTFIKTMSGVHQPTKGEILFEGKPMNFATPVTRWRPALPLCFKIWL